MTKPHITVSADPLHRHKNYVALCGKEIPNADFPFIFDFCIPQRLEDTLNRLNTCAKCMDRAIHSSGRYYYGLIPGAVEGQDSKPMEGV